MIKIEGWSAKNFRNLELVDIKVEDYVLRVSGKNGAGKSSVIEAIFIAILGPKYAGQNSQRLIKSGKETATITVNMIDGDRELEITRTITDSGMKLKVKTSDDSKVTQAYLDSLINTTMIDPLKWANSKASEQIADVKEKAGIDTSELESKYDDLFDERKFQNREVKRLKGVADSFADVKDPGEGISMSEMLAERDSILEFNYNAEKSNAAIFDAKEKVIATKEAIRIKQELIARLNTELYDMEGTLTDTEKFVKESKETEMKSLVEVDASIEEAEAMQEALTIYGEKIKAEETLVEAEEISEESTKALADILKEIDDVVLSADLPFSNIGFDKDLGVIVDGIPISEHSTAEQIKIAVKLNSKFAPHLKVIYIKDGSLLDRDTLEELEDLGVDQEYLFLVELVEEQEDSIVIRSGSVLSDDESAEEDSKGTL